jgi:hypothetical protein
MSRLKGIIVITLLGGCAVCQQHPVACVVASGMVATSIAISVDRGRDNRSAPLRATTQPVNCSNGSCQ